MVMRAIVFFFACFVLMSCGAQMAKEEAMQADSAGGTDQISNAPLPDIYSDGVSKLIKKAHYRFQSKDVKHSLEAIEKAIRQYPAFISSSSLTLENPLLESRLSIKVQNQYFDELLREIDKEAVFVNFRNISTEDVSKQFVDLESRLKSKREVEERLMAILRNKAGTMEEVLEAEKQIGELHEEIEAVVSRLNFLKDQVKYSTIELEIYQTVTEVTASVEDESFIQKMGTALKSGLDGVASVVLALVYIWPLLVLALAIWMWLRKTKGFGLRTGRIS